jgi:adenylate cyclase
MHPELERSEMRRAVREEKPRLDAWDCVMRGWWHYWNQFTKEDCVAARRSFERAIELDPHSSDALAGLAHIHYNEIVEQWTDSLPESVAELNQAARRSVELDPNNPFAQLALNLAARVTGQTQEMIAAATRAVDLNPSYSRAYAELAIALAEGGRSEQALEYIERGMRLSPRDPMMWWFFRSASLVHFADGRYDEAVEWGRRLVQATPRLASSWRILAASLAQLGRLDEARSAFEQVLQLQPQYSLAGTRTALAAADPDYLKRYIDGLRKAGLKE